MTRKTASTFMGFLRKSGLPLSIPGGKLGTEGYVRGEWHLTFNWLVFCRVSHVVVVGKSTPYI